MKSFFRILRYLKPYKLNISMNMLFNLLSVVFSLFSILMIIPFLQVLFKKEFAPPIKPELDLSFDTIREYFNYFLTQLLFEKGTIAALIFICLFVAGTSFLKNLFRYLALYFMTPARTGISRDIRSNLFGKILQLPLSYYTEERKGDVMTRISSDVQEVEWSILNTLEVLFKEPLNILFSILLLLLISPGLTIIILLLLPVTGFIIGRIGRKLKSVAHQGQSRLGELFSLIEETLTGMRIIKAFSAEKKVFNRFEKINQFHYRLNVKLLRRRDLASPLSEFLNTLVVAFVLYIGSTFVLNDALEPSTFIGFLLVFANLINPVRTLTNAYFQIQKGLASAERIEKLLDSPVSITEKSDALPIRDFKDRIEFRNVSFAYRELPVLEEINLIIQKGKKVALVGPSGAGKSTLADLLPRFYDVKKGEVLIDGKDIRDLKLDDLRRLLGVVTQESILFNDTVANNISFGIENASEQDIKQAAIVANAHDFIQKMENGYQTLIGERGGRLSGGEKQRLTIARAVLADPSILILDEATSSLDSESEKLVQDALSRLMQNRTSIIIAHRLSTIQDADEIVVMQNGRIVERGSHEMLMKENKNYRKLVEMQGF